MALLADTYDTTRLNIREVTGREFVIRIAVQDYQARQCCGTAYQRVDYREPNQYTRDCQSVLCRVDPAPD